MSEQTYAHNHPPHCCCRWALDVDSYAPTTICPQCPEHGELSQLSAEREAAEIEPMTPSQLRAIEPTDAAHDAAECIRSVDGWCETCSTADGPVYHGEERRRPQLEPTDAAHDAAVAAALAGTRLAGPCSSCHQLAQRPPTEYCQTPELHSVQP